MRVNEIVSGKRVTRTHRLIASMQLNTAERIDASVVATNVAALLSCFALYLCLPNPYHKALDALWLFLAAENAAYYEAKGVQFQNPACNGLTHIDLLVRQSAAKRKDGADADDEPELETAASSDDGAAAAAVNSTTATTAAAVAAPLNSSDSDAPLLASSTKKERRRRKK